METNIQIFNYNGTDITMKKENGCVYVNLTEIAKAFPEKNLSQIVKSQEISEYVQELAAIYNYIAPDLLQVINGVGTWAHQRVALRVCQKLSTKFSIWVDTKIEEILTTGVSTSGNDDEAILHAMQVLQKRVESGKQQLQIAQGTIEHQQKRISVLEPKAEFMDRVMDADQKIDIGQAAKILRLPFGRNTLFVKLREKGVFFKNRNEPKQEYVERGYFELKEKWIDRDHHDGFMVVKVLVTQHGLDFIAKLFEVVPDKKKYGKNRVKHLHNEEKRMHIMINDKIKTN